MQPDEQRLAQAIAAAFERLPQPRLARLEAIERRLTNVSRARSARRPRAAFWWLMAALFATGAAAWWGGEYWRGEVSPKSPTPVSGVTEQAGHRDAQGTGRTENAGSGANVKPESESSAPTVYRREVY